MFYLFIYFSFESYFMYHAHRYTHLGITRFLFNANLALVPFVPPERCSLEQKVSKTNCIGNDGKSTEQVTAFFTQLL